jgi:hypothetical protein
MNKILCTWMLACLPLSALAETVEVRAQRLPVDGARTDISRVCPAIHAQLPEALASAQQALWVQGVVQVQVRLQGREVLEVAAQGGPRATHRFIRQAMQALDCRSEGSAPQVFALAVRFGATPASGVALLTP